MKNNRPCYCRDCKRTMPAGHGELHTSPAKPWVNRGGYTVYQPGEWYVTCKTETVTVEAPAVGR
ncbi:MAG: hypothetical protein WC565_04930 [Parcubacteria group bacterium]|jgi:hypothetical protein